VQSAPQNNVEGFIFVPHVPCARCCAAAKLCGMAGRKHGAFQGRDAVRQGIANRLATDVAPLAPPGHKRRTRLCSIFPAVLLHQFRLAWR
jgi:hypothetical protein